MTRRLTLGLALVALLVQADVARSAQSILSNASMESGTGPFAEDPRIPADWVRLGNVVERSGEANLVPAGDGHALKAFQSNPTELAYQEVPVAPGESVTISAQLYTRANDKVGGDAVAGIALGFYNAGGGQIGSTQTAFVLDANSPADTWIPASIGPAVAPANTAKARMTCIWISSAGSGAAFWDDAEMTINGGPNEIINGDFEQAGFGEQSPTGIDEWQGFNDQQKSEDFAFHGSSSVKIGTTEQFSGLFQNRPDYVVQDGDRLLLRARVWQSSGSPLTSTARAGIKLEFAATSGGGLPPPYQNLPFDADSTTNAWEMVDLGTTGLIVPANANQARVTLIFAPNASPPNGAIYFDAAHAGVNSGPNLLLNASFETGAVCPTNWTCFATEGESFAVKSAFEVPGYPDVFGGSSAKAFGDAFAGFWQEIAVTPGQTLDAHVQMYMRKDLKLEGTSRAGIKIEWKGGSVPPPVDITPDASDNTITAASPTDTWIPLEIDFTMPAGTEAHPRFVTLVATGAGAGAAYFDACELVVVNAFDGADADGDDDEDLADFAQFQRCFDGEGPPGNIGFNCTVFDVDENLVIDLVDFDFFQPRLTGP